MRIGIDAHALGSHLGGNETYIRNVITALGELDQENEYTLFVNDPQNAAHLAHSEEMRRVKLWPRAAMVRIPLTLPLLLARHRIDLLHVQYVAPPLCPSRVVVSVHDIAYERYPQFFTGAEVRRFQILVPRTIQHAQRVLTLSEYSKQDLMRRYLVPEEKIVVAGCAADPAFTRILDPVPLERVRARYHTGDNFVLCVGNLQPRKNIRRLIEAYVRMRQSGVVSHRLVMVGRRAWLYDEAFAAARESGYADDLIFTDYVPLDDLVALFNAADLFVYPSIFEGFGLPPLEAMACGTPVLTSNTSAIPEIVGEAAVLVDPLDVEEIATEMAHILREPALRRHLAEAGLARAQRFSWRQTAGRVLHAYTAE